MTYHCNILVTATNSFVATYQFTKVREGGEVAAWSPDGRAHRAAAARRRASLAGRAARWTAVRDLRSGLDITAY